MRMRSPKYKDEVIANCSFLVTDELNFAKEQPLYIEIGRKIYFSAGSEKNIKLTTPEDIDIFKALLKIK